MFIDSDDQYFVE